MTDRSDTESIKILDSNVTKKSPAIGTQAFGSANFGVPIAT